MRYAWKEVKDSDKTLSEIAMENGFPNSKALARSFQKNTDASKRISKKREVTVHNNKEQEIDIK